MERVEGPLLPLGLGSWWRLLLTLPPFPQGNKGAKGERGERGDRGLRGDPVSIAEGASQSPHSSLRGRGGEVSSASSEHVLRVTECCWTRSNSSQPCSLKPRCCWQWFIMHELVQSMHPAHLLCHKKPPCPWNQDNSYSEFSKTNFQASLFLCNNLSWLRRRAM